MTAKSFALSCLAAVAMGHAINVDHDTLPCRHIEPAPAYLQFVKELTANHTMKSMESKQFASSAAAAPINVNIYAHVVAASKSADGGYLSESDVRTQLKAMNDQYSSSGFTFTVKDIDWTVNATWSNDGDEMAMKKALRKGNYSTLNIYFQNDLGGPSGYCYFPTTASPGSSAYIKDGCSVLAKTVPKGTTTPHETGHWLGLYHTFQGGCSGQGDMVDDTPACQSSRSCDESTDTCPDVPGLDLVHNFMGYGACRSEFTKGQAARMQSSWKKFRG